MIGRVVGTTKLAIGRLGTYTGPASLVMWTIVVLDIAHTRFWPTVHYTRFQAIGITVAILLAITIATLDLTIVLRLEQREVSRRHPWQTKIDDIHTEVMQ